MTDVNDLENTRSKPVADPAEQEQTQMMDAGRRRLAKAGLFAPIVITLASRPGNAYASGGSGGSGH